MFAFADDILNINNLNKKITHLSSSSSIPVHSNSGILIQWTVFMLTVIIIAVILFFVYKFVKSKSIYSSGNYLEVLDTVFLDNNNKVSIVRLGSGYYLIAYNSNSVVKISDIEDESIIENLKLNLSTNKSFKNIFLSKTTKNFTIQKAKDRLKNLK